MADSIGSSWNNQEPQRGGAQESVKWEVITGAGIGVEGGTGEGTLEKNGMTNGVKVGTSKI